MIKVSVLYPNTPDGRFDMEYYVKQHIPMVLERCAGWAKPDHVEQGVGGGAADAEAPYRVVGSLFFDSMESMQASFGRHLGEFVADLPNFTNIEPRLQIRDVVI